MAAALPAIAVNVRASSEAAGLHESVLNENPLRLGLMTYLVGSKWDIDTIIKNCKEARFEHVQLRTTHAHGVEVTLTAAQRADVKRRFAEAGLAISLASGFQYHSPDPAELRKNIEGTKQFLQLAADVGALGIRVFPNALPAEGEPTRQKILEQIGKSVSECATTGNDLGVQVRLEEHGRGTSNIPVIRQILDHADNPHLYIIWNNSDSDYTGEGLPKGYEGMSLEEQFNLVKGRIGNVHLRELFTDYPWRRLFKLLSDSGYEGYCDIELSDESCEPVRMMKNYRVGFLALQNAL
ncbi:MAG: sugar phosphate isomerase/epimerase [Acidobacteriota bacterium]|nr:MAG: sugar phosphate isomerase/epimerase [Acidobacteriota bacterium]